MTKSESLSLRLNYGIFALLLVAQLAILWSVYQRLANPLAVIFLIGISGVIALLVTLNFELASYLFILSLIFNQDLTSSMRVRIADIIAAFLILNFFLRVVVTRQLKIHRTPLDGVIFLFLGIMGLSLLNAKSLTFGIVNYLRHVELFLVMYCLYYCLELRMFKRLIYLFITVVSVNALISNILFVTSGGGFRSFGLAGNEFTDMVVPASIIAYVISFFEASQKKRIALLGVTLNLVIALYATGTRGAMVSWVIGFFLANLALLLHPGVSKRRIFALGLVAPVILGSFALQFGYESSHGVISPYQGFVDTVDFRFALWYLAIKSFLDHPILGIGLNQFMRIEEVYPSVKFNVLYPYIKGLDAHSVVLNFAANTGVLGLTLLGVFFYKILKLSWGTYRKFKLTSEASINLCLGLAISYIVYSSLYAGLWFWSLNGFEFMFFLAFILKLHDQELVN